MRRVVALVVALALVLGMIGVALSLVFAGDGTDDPGGRARRTGPAPTSTPGPGDQVAPEPALQRFYGQELGWRDCEDGHECADLEVPVDYDRPRGDTIEIALLKVPAEDPGLRIGSLVVNPGGPGAPGTDYAAQARLVFGEPLRERYDIVGFDPRGTGESAPVDCLDDQELTEYLSADPLPEPGTEAQLREALVEFHAGCRERTGPLLGHVGTAEAARDMDVLRSALGESELTYFGASYGTRLGATYAELFADRAGRLVLDGAVDPTISSRELSLGQAGGFETALRSYVQNCLDISDSCFLGDSVDAGVRRIQTFLEDVREEPLPAGDRRLRVGDAFYGLITPLYNRDYWVLLSTGLRQAFGGDGSTMLLLADAYASRNPDGSYLNNSTEAIVAINCLDDPSALDPTEIAAEVPAFEEVSPTFGAVLAWGMGSCLAFPDDGAQPRELTAAGAAPIVVVGTTRDPATPYAWAQALAEQLESGVLLTRDGDGHTAYLAGNSCIDETIEAFLIDGTVPEDGLTC